MKQCTRKILIILFVSLSLTTVFAQNKNEQKAEQTLAKAFEQTDNAKKNEMIAKATELFTAAGLQKEAPARIGDAFLEHNDLTNAYNYYNRLQLKELKAASMRKLGEAYVELAFNEPKNEAKHLKKALDIYIKGNSVKEGYKRIAVKYEEKGIEYYGKAVDNYLLAGDTGSVQNIAEKYENAGGEYLSKAAETYNRLQNVHGYKKAGDIYWVMKEYETAFSAYNNGNYIDGIKLYAEYLTNQGRIIDADMIFTKLVDRYYKTGRLDEMKPMAEKAMQRGSYTLAKEIYERLADLTNSNRAAAYESLSNFQLDEAKKRFSNYGNAALVKAITANANALSSLQELSQIVEDLRKGKPEVSMTKNEAGLTIPNLNDLRAEEEYYSNMRNSIIDNVFNVSALLQKITSPELRNIAASRFMRYKAFRELLESSSFKTKKVRDNIVIQDVYL